MPSANYIIIVPMSNGSDVFSFITFDAVVEHLNGAGAHVQMERCHFESPAVDSPFWIYISRKLTDEELVFIKLKFNAEPFYIS